MVKNQDLEGTGSASISISARSPSNRWSNLLKTFTGSCSIFSGLSGSLGGAPTGNFLPRLDTEADLTGAVVFFLNSYSMNNFYCILICRASSWPGKLSSASAEYLSAFLRLFGWWSFWPHWIVRLSPKLYQFGQHKTLSAWLQPMQKEVLCQAATKSWSPVLFCAHQDKKFSSQSQPFFICFSFHTLQSLDDDGCAPSQFMHLAGLVQGPWCSRAHCCGTSSLGSMSVLLTLKAT